MGLGHSINDCTTCTDQTCKRLQAIGCLLALLLVGNEAQRSPLSLSGCAPSFPLCLNICLLHAGMAVICTGDANKLGLNWACNN